MAGAEIVPWTDPGGTSCCCVNQCFDSLDEPDPPVSDGWWFEIPTATYEAMLDRDGTFGKIQQGRWYLEWQIYLTDRNDGYHPNFYSESTWTSPAYVDELTRLLNFAPQYNAASPCDISWIASGFQVVRQTKEIWKSGVSGQTAGSIRNTFNQAITANVAIAASLATISGQNFINIRARTSAWPDHSIKTLYTMPRIESEGGFVFSDIVYHFPFGNFDTVNDLGVVSSDWQELTVGSVAHAISIDIGGTIITPNGKVYYDSPESVFDPIANHSPAGAVTASLRWEAPAP